MIFTHKKQNRKLSEIAQDIRANWPNPYFGAKPYLDALSNPQDERIEGNYFDDSNKSIVRYLLGNMQTFKGEHARRLKGELKGMIY